LEPNNVFPSNYEEVIIIMSKATRLILSLVALCISTSELRAERVGPEDVLYLSFSAHSHWYEENYGSIHLGAEIGAIYGKNVASGPSIVNRDGWLGRAAPQRRPKVDVTSDGAFVYVSYLHNKGYCGRTVGRKPNCKIHYKYSLPLPFDYEKPASYDPSIKVQVFGGRTEAASPPILVANSTCLRKTKCRKFRNYAPEPGGYLVEFRYVNN
jgi:hypothetical protein